jgi:peptidoglycan/LPS O-acetylase OafA/YrhL
MSIILTQKAAGTFSLMDFYERRARRILPALFVVMASCIPFGWLWLMPSDMKGFTESLAAVSLFASNILFWRESGYFTTAAELKPLLHTWSLAVEEQYYVLLPIFMLMMWRFAKRWVFSSLVVVAGFSFGLAQWGAYTKPAANFFLLPTRGWEIVIGALLAYYFTTFPKQQPQRPILETGGLLGLLLIIYAVFSYSKEIPYPSSYTLAPVLGAALIVICATPKTIAGRILSMKIFVSIGLISYSAYLWHQPIIAFSRYIGVDQYRVPFRIGTICLTFILAMLTYKFIETPFRDKTAINRAKLWVFVFIATTLFLNLGAFGYLRDGKFGAMVNNERYQQLTDRMRGNHGLHRDCARHGSNDSPNCRTSESPEILLWGDSFAMHLAQGFVASNKDVRMIQATESTCPPVIDLAPAIAIHGANNCIQGNDRAIQLILKYPSIKYVVLSSPSFLLGIPNVVSREGTSNFSDIEIEKKFVATLETIISHGATPIIFSPPPMSGENIGQCLLHNELHNIKSSSRCDFPLLTLNTARKFVYEMLNRLETKYRVVWLKDGICEDGTCHAQMGNAFLYRDGGHLSYEGSKYLGEKMNFYDLVKNSKP